MLLFFTGLWIKLRQEEALMLTRFPDEHSTYQQRVKRIIPWVF